ncbi:hypothetical protein [Spirillospora sp. NBC_01491]|uniref:hypothetical protein n=1 Tax=Spirillospora sp. NBC_01491 TaxID=2976007 RepID=UPI002E3010D9|nr:hypothetical protein [Spirillospora sp. NBC_01491]
MLHLYDHRTGRAEELPPGPVRVHVQGGAERALVTADLLRRVADRGRLHPTVTRSADARPRHGAAGELSVPEFEVRDAAPDGALLVGPDEPDARSLVVPPEDGAWPVPSADEDDVLCVRLAMLRARYRDPVDVAALLPAARDDLARWRGLIAQWAEGPGRPIARAYAAEAEAAFADDLDSPAALTVLDRLADDPGVQPGAKLETFINLDLILALNLVADIGRR